MLAINSALGRLASFAPVVLRVTLGALILYHGIDKFDTGLSNVEGFFDSQGVPAPGLSAWFVAIAEVVIGIALIVGAFTRIAATVMVAILVGALIFVKLDGDVLGGGSEVDFAYIAGLVALMFLGPGRASVDEAMQNDETVIDLRTSRSVVKA